MVKKNLKLVWTKNAECALEHIYRYIEEYSPQNARKVIKDIQNTAKKLVKSPEIHQVDEYYSNNPGNIRRFFNWSYRTTYEIRKEAIVILNIFHSSMDSSRFKK